MVNIYHFEQGSEAWHDIRIGRVTASKFSDLMAGKSTATYKGLLYTTAGEIVSETREESYSNAIMERGVELEPDARALYEEYEEVLVDEVGFVTNDNYLPEYFGVSPDGMIGHNGLIEIKCPIMKTHVGYIEDNRLPNTYKWQVQGQLLITNREWCDFVSYYPNLRIFVHRVYRDEKMHAELVERMNEFVDELQPLIKML